MGADISWVQEDEANGTVYYDHGKQQDIFQILKDHGFNAIRLRVFVNPASPHGYAAASKEAYCDLAHTLVMAKRAHDHGMALLIDLHYSDTWADPGKQTKPAAWEHLDFPALRKAVYDHTFAVLSALKQQGTEPQMVQIGNEITNGMLWPDGRARDHFDQFAELLKSGIAGARAVDPHIKVVLHHDKGKNNQVVRAWLDKLIARGVQFDIIGLSCNDTGSPDRWKENFNDLAKRYPQYGLIAAEYSYHKRELNDAVFHAPDRRGIGTFIWEPTRHHEAIFSPHRAKDGEKDEGPKPGTVGSAGHRPRTGRFDTNDLIDLYPQMSNEFAKAERNGDAASFKLAASPFRSQTAFGCERINAKAPLVHAEAECTHAASDLFARHKTQHSSISRSFLIFHNSRRLELPRRLWRNGLQVIDERVVGTLCIVPASLDPSTFLDQTSVPFEFRPGK